MNKPQNTPENKARFFALYWGQNVMREYGLLKINNYKVSYLDENFPDHWLELTPLSQISDEDVTNLTNSFMKSRKELLDYYCSESHLQALKMLLKDLKPEDYDYLRSTTYALPWMGLSVDDLAEYGWVKLKEI